MTKKTMVSGVKVLALLLLVNVAVVQARQVLNNFNMDGCPASFPGDTGPLTGWTGTSSLPCTGGACSATAVGLTTGGPMIDPNFCAAYWEAGFSPISQTLSLSALEISGRFYFQAFWACFENLDPGTCTVSLSIGGTNIPLSGATTRNSAFPVTYTSVTASGISIANPNAVVSINCVPTGNTFCFLTQATLNSQATVIADPRIFGLDGQQFEFLGQAGAAYSILSDTDVQVNCLLGVQQVGEFTFASGPVMMIIAILTPNHTILANAGGHFENDTGFVSVDGVKVAEGEKVVTEDGISVSFQIVNAKARDLGLGSDSDDHIAATSQIEIKGSYRFTVYFVENKTPDHPGSLIKHKYVRRFVDLSTVLLDDERAPHGILGQTHLRGEDKKRSIKDWKMEGTEDDYRLGDGVLGSDFAFNKFRV